MIIRIFPLDPKECVQRGWADSEGVQCSVYTDPVVQPSPWTRSVALLAAT